MNLNIDESIKLAKELKEKTINTKDKDILICPSFTALKDVNEIIKESNICLGAQNVCYEDKGAFTGEISPEMLKEVGCGFVLVGHSERRHIFKETDEIVNLRLKNSIKNKIQTILCIGETLEQREANKTKEIITTQLIQGLKDITDLKGIIIAYEPVWAIGTGKTASPEQAQEVHSMIRNLIKKDYDQETSDKIKILYGGSVKPDDSKDLMTQSDIDGALVGGASLKSEDFYSIINF